jgi:hypothetical protein
VAPFSLPRKACSILDGLKDVVFLATVFNVLAITFDRYQAVIKSLRYRTRITKKTVIFILILVWLVPWPIAYLKQILINVNPSFFQAQSREQIYDNIVVFTCIIFPMVILLVVNTLLTKAIRSQVAKISIPGNLYWTTESKQEIERNDVIVENRKVDGTAPTFEPSEKKDVEEDTLRTGDNYEDEINKMCRRNMVSDNINLGYEGDEEDGKNDILEGLKNHVISESHDYHVTIPSLDLSSSQNNADYDAPKSNSVGESVNLESNENKIINFFSHEGEIQQVDNCCHKVDVLHEGTSEVQTKPEHKNQLEDEKRNVRITGKDVELEALKPTRRRKLGSVVQPVENVFANTKSVARKVDRGKGFSKVIDNQNCCASSKPKTEEKKEEGLQKQEFYKRKSRSCVLRDSLTRENTSKRIVRYNFEFSDVQTIQDKGKQGVDGFGEAHRKELLKDSFDERTASPEGRTNPSFESSDSMASSSNHDVTSSGPNESERKPVKVCMVKPTYHQEHQREKKETINERKQIKSSLKSCLNRDSLNSEKDGDDRKSISFQEHKQDGEETSTSFTISTKRLRKLSREKKERNGTRSCLIVALIFVICWIPRCLFNFFLLFPPRDIINLYLLEKISMLFLFLQSLTNPLVYSVYRKDFRQAAKDLIRKIISCRRNNHG